MSIAWSLVSFSFFFSLITYALSPFEVLKVKENATDEEIKKAYLKRVTEVHPDKSNLPKEQAEAEFKAVQSAWEQISKLRRSESIEQRLDRHAENRQLAEKQLAKEEARKILDSQWSQGRFSSKTIQDLPRFQAGQRQPLFGLPHNRSPKDDGEWEAIEEFFKRHQSEIIESNPKASDLHQMLAALDTYKELTGQFVQSVRKGLLEPLEQAVFERAHDKTLFLKALQSKIERMGRAGIFLNSSRPAEEREKALKRPAELFSKRFGNSQANSIRQLAEAALENTFSEVEANPTTLHEMGPLIRGFAAALPPEDSLHFLGSFLEKLDSLPSRYQVKSDLRELKARAASEVERIFSQNPDLKKLYLDKTSFWKRITAVPSTCDLILGKIARTSE